MSWFKTKGQGSVVLWLCLPSTVFASGFNVRILTVVYHIKALTPSFTPHVPHVTQRPDTIPDIANRIERWRQDLRGIPGFWDQPCKDDPPTELGIFQGRNLPWRWREVFLKPSRITKGNSEKFWIGVGVVDTKKITSQQDKTQVKISYTLQVSAC